ncbi:MAG TPA: hypothetical protein VNZ94_00575 [Xanthobacteraceae bacterium]|nr:hypothetical protein [Xanthobacteraceae bacterium]
MEQCIEKSKAPRGQTIVRSFGRDDSSMDVANSHGKEMKGGTNNLSHSLTGSSAVQDK